jgi:hypothetical protein
MSTSSLRIYMNDQLAAGVLWRELARRAARENEGNDAGAALAAVARGIAEDVVTFESLMSRLGLRRNIVKPRAAVVLERLGRIKVNGSWTSYNALSRFWELDVLVLGIVGKKQLWTNIRDLAACASRLPDVDFDALIARAEAQRAVLEPHRERAGREALGGVPLSATFGPADEADAGTRTRTPSLRDI